MIVSASRRTDIPRFHFDWLLGRFEEGFALVRNPAVRTRVSRVILSPDTVDCVAFWTKDPSVLLARKTELDRVCPSPYFVQFTLNAYGADVEAGLPRKARLLETFRSLADALGPDRVVWRYSPILLGGAYDIAHHMQWFEAFAARLEGSTRTCRISFLDMYPKIAGRMAALGFVGVPEEAKAALALRLAELGAAHGIEVGGCGDGALNGRLPSERRPERVLPVRLQRAPRQRHRCTLLEPAPHRRSPSVDIGTYDTCANGCVYCYANPGTSAAPCGAADPWRLRRYDPASPMLCDELTPDDTVEECASAKLPEAPPRLF